MTDVIEAVKAVVGELVSARHWKDGSFINLPLVYPGGGSVTVKVDSVPGGYRVSDNGFAYREIECIGAQRSFAKAADKIAEAECLQRNSRALFVDVPPEQLYRAICDVGTASWRVAARIFSRAAEQQETEIEEYVRKRVIEIFGDSKVQPDAKVTGASTSEWDVTAVVRLNGAATVFQAVGAHANAVYRASAAFHDLAALEQPPKLVAVVHDKEALGPRFGLLSQVSRVIQEDQPDEVYRRAAA